MLPATALALGHASRETAEEIDGVLSYSFQGHDDAPNRPGFDLMDSSAVSHHDDTVSQSNRPWSVAQSLTALRKQIGSARNRGVSARGPLAPPPSAPARARFEEDDDEGALTDTSVKKAAPPTPGPLIQDAGPVRPSIIQRLTVSSYRLPSAKATRRQTAGRSRPRSAAPKVAIAAAWNSDTHTGNFFDPSLERRKAVPVAPRVLPAVSSLREKPARSTELDRSRAQPITETSATSSTSSVITGAASLAVVVRPQYHLPLHAERATATTEPATGEQTRGLGGRRQSAATEDAPEPRHPPTERVTWADGPLPGAAAGAGADGVHTGGSVDARRAARSADNLKYLQRLYGGSSATHKRPARPLGDDIARSLSSAAVPAPVTGIQSVAPVSPPKAPPAAPPPRPFQYKFEAPIVNLAPERWKRTPHRDNTMAGQQMPLEEASIHELSVPSASFVRDVSTAAGWVRVQVRRAGDALLPDAPAHPPPTPSPSGASAVALVPVTPRTATMSAAAEHVRHAASGDLPVDPAPCVPWQKQTVNPTRRRDTGGVSSASSAPYRDILEERGTVDGQLRSGRNSYSDAKRPLLRVLSDASRLAHAAASTADLDTLLARLQQAQAVLDDGCTRLQQAQAVQDDGCTRLQQAQAVQDEVNSRLVLDDVERRQNSVAATAAEANIVDEIDSDVALVMSNALPLPSEEDLDGGLASLPLGVIIAAGTADDAPAEEPRARNLDEAGTAAPISGSVTTSSETSRGWQRRCPGRYPAGADLTEIRRAEEVACTWPPHVAEAAAAYRQSVQRNQRVRDATLHAAGLQLTRIAAASTDALLEVLVTEIAAKLDSAAGTVAEALIEAV